MTGLIIAAAASGSGKTTLTLGLLRHLRGRGMRVGAVKTGPDYIDAAFLSAAAGVRCVNLDTWAMQPNTVAGLAGGLSDSYDMVVCEGVMGLFDGALGPADGKIAPGSTAALAVATGWPVILVVDGRGQAGSAGALVKGFATYDPAVTISGLIFNRVASPRHGDMLCHGAALGAPDVPVLGCVGRDGVAALPSRHLGLVQAMETPGLEQVIDEAAAAVAGALDVDAIIAMAAWERCGGRGTDGAAAGPGQRIAVAQDAAFSFTYAHVIDGWRASGAEILAFSPLANEAPAADADAVYLPGGYPELHAGQLANNRSFLDGVRAAAARGAVVWGECGGYMVLGDRLQDSDGDWHRMAGLLPLTTSMAGGRLRLGYRQARMLAASGLGAAGTVYRGHEFHHGRIVEEGPGTALAEVSDAAGNDLGNAGLVVGNVAGSFIHFIDRWTNDRGAA